jgi:hypothetical protein
MSYRHTISTDLGQIRLERVKGKDSYDLEISKQRNDTMTKSQARALILVLSAKRISFKLRRDNNLYIVSFDRKHAQNIKQAIGD